MRYRVVTVSFLALCLLAARVAFPAQQPAKVPRVGVLLFSTPQADDNLPSFRQGLRDLGYVEGQNVFLEYRYAEGRPERFPELAADLVRLKPDVIVAVGTDVALPVKKATETIPIVFLSSRDPLRSGLVVSLARPGGNATGVTLIFDDLAPKRLQLLKQAAPQTRRVAFLWNPNHADAEYPEAQGAAETLGVHLQSLEVRGPDDLPAAFRAAMDARPDALYVVSSRLTNLHRQTIVDFAAKNRLPLAGGRREWAHAGALLSHGPDVNLTLRRMAAYVDKILKGAKPADLPVEQPTRFELVVNLKTAKALGITLPQSILLRADQVLQ